MFHIRFPLFFSITGLFRKRIVFVDAFMKRNRFNGLRVHTINKNILRDSYYNSLWVILYSFILILCFSFCSNNCWNNLIKQLKSYSFDCDSHSRLAKKLISILSTKKNFVPFFVSKVALNWYQFCDEFLAEKKEEKGEGEGGRKMAKNHLCFEINK